MTKKVEEELMEERYREGRVIKEASDQERELKRMQVEAKGHLQCPRVVGQTH